jgi:prepilin-type N-terminal cleavage/methylation domain-containing protein
MTSRGNRSFIDAGCAPAARAVSVAPTVHQPRLARGFSLVEILVVVTIIGVLLAIGLVVGERVTTGAQRTATQGKLIILDQALAAYQSERGGANPPAYVRVSDPELTNPTDWRYMLLARGVAQLGSASRSGREGRRFESSHPDCHHSWGVATREHRDYRRARRRWGGDAAIARSSCGVPWRPVRGCPQSLDRSRRGYWPE